MASPLCHRRHLLVKSRIPVHFRNPFPEQRFDLVADSFDIVAATNHAFVLVEVFQNLFIITETEGVSVFPGEPPIDLDKENRLALGVMDIEILHPISFDEPTDVLQEMFRVATNHIEGEIFDFDTFAFPRFGPVDVYRSAAALRDGEHDYCQGLFHAGYIWLFLRVDLAPRRSVCRQYNHALRFM